MPDGSRTLTDRAAFAVIGTLATLCILAIPELGSDPWRFDAPEAKAQGLFGPLVALTSGVWTPDDVPALPRAAAMLALVGVMLCGVLVPHVRARRPLLLGLLTALVCIALVVPAAALQAGLRDGTAPWFHVNDSTFQIEIAGELVRDGDNPYGHDYRDTDLARWYSFDGTAVTQIDDRTVALTAFPYVPGTALTAAAWGALPAPLDDYRMFVVLCTLALLPAALLFGGPISLRLAVGAALAANPLAIRAGWFGTADAPSLLAVVIAFALVMRRRPLGAALALAVAIALKQFALVALPFLAVLVWRRERAAVVRAGVVLAGALVLIVGPLALAGPAAFWDDVVRFGAESYRIVGYGLAGILVEADLVERGGSYPFTLLALLVWAPATALLVRSVWRSGAVWPAAAGYAVSSLLLFWLGRVFQTSYLLYVGAGMALALLLAAAESDEGEHRPDHRVLEEGVVEQ